MKKKVYTGHITLSKAEFLHDARLDVKFSGVSMSVAADNKGDYNNTSTEVFAMSAKDLKLPSTEGMQVPAGLEVQMEDFLLVPFRLISATMVAAGTWRSTFFKPSVLKQAVNLLKGKGVFTDHDDRPKNWLGFVAETKWQAQSLQNGTVVPAGINGLLAIDTKQERNKDVARGVLAGSVYSNSVGIMFKYTMSHDYADEWSFYNRIGTMHEDGTMVHMAATEIIDIYETSLVSLGADPYAKRIDEEGNLVNVDNGGVYDVSAQNSADYASDAKFCAFHKEKTQKNYEILWGLNKNVLLLSGKVKTQTKQFKMNEQVLTTLLEFLGVASLEALTEKTITDLKAEAEANKALATVANKVTLSLNKGNDLEAIFTKHELVEKEALAASKQQLETLTADKAALELEKEALAKDAKIGKDYLVMQRELAKKFYRLVKMEQSSEVVCGLIDKADEKELAALIKEHGIVIGGEFSFSCGDCGSHTFNFQSSKQAPETKDTPKIMPLTTPDSIREEQKRKKIFGE